MRPGCEPETPTQAVPCRGNPTRRGGKRSTPAFRYRESPAFPDRGTKPSIIDASRPPPGNTRTDANRGTQSAEYSTVEARLGIRAVEVPGASGRQNPFGRTVCVRRLPRDFRANQKSQTSDDAGTHARSRNRAATVERPTRKRLSGPRKRAIVNSSGNPAAETVGGGQSNNNGEGSVGSTTLSML